MQLPDVILSKIPTDITRVQIIATDLKNVTSNNFTEQLDDTVSDPFELRFKADNLKMIPGDYSVSASTSAGVSNWVGKEASYWIGTEAKIE